IEDMQPLDDEAEADRRSLLEMRSGIGAAAELRAARCHGVENDVRSGELDLRHQRRFANARARVQRPYRLRPCAELDAAPVELREPFAHALDRDLVPIRLDDQALPLHPGAAVQQDDLALADEIRDEHIGGTLVDLARGGELLEASLVED